MLESGDLGLGVLSPVVGDWNLPTEPWTFLIDGKGKVFARFEAFATRNELTGAMESLLAGDTWRPG
jgi:glutathione peroxidase-family protein